MVVNLLVKNHTKVKQWSCLPELSLSVARPTAVFICLMSSPSPPRGGFPKDPDCVGVAKAMHFDGTEIGGGKAL